jgi:hypothetical protein
MNHRRSHRLRQMEHLTLTLSRLMNTLCHDLTILLLLRMLLLQLSVRMLKLCLRLMKLSLSSRKLLTLNLSLSIHHLLLMSRRRHSVRVDTMTSDMSLIMRLMSLSLIMRMSIHIRNHMLNLPQRRQNRMIINPRRRISRLLLSN